MRLLFVVQRYGEAIVGGSENACRMFAERLVARGHAVEVLTSCAHSAHTMADEYPAGSHLINGVLVHRLPVEHQRRPDVFGPLDQHVHHGPRPMRLSQQRLWHLELGPRLRGQRRWLLAHTTRFDAVHFFAFQYPTTVMGLPTVASRVPTLLHAAAHDEPALWLTGLDTVLRLPDAYCFFSPEERALISRRLHQGPTGVETGIGIDEPGIHDASLFRRRVGIGDRPYLLFMGRFDELKGGPELVRMFVEAKRRHRRSPLLLVCAGDRRRELSDDPSVVAVGYLDEELKSSALRGAMALVQPSYMESFSIVVCEAWARGRPVLGQAACDVVRGQIERSRGGLVYNDHASFEQAVMALAASPELADRMGADGRAYVRDRYHWPRVLDAIESCISLAHAHFSDRWRPGGVRSFDQRGTIAPSKEPS